MGKTRSDAGISVLQLPWAASLLPRSPDAAEGASLSSMEASAQNGAVPCTWHRAGLQKHFIQSILSEFQVAVKVFIWA